MPTVVESIISRVQTLVADLGQDWADPDLICKHLVIANDDLEPELQARGLNYDTQVVILPAIAANTTSLDAYMQDGGPLSGLVLPRTLEWRQIGQNQEQWLQVPYVQKVIDTDTGTGISGSDIAANFSDVESFEWRNGRVILSPCSQPVDLRVRGQFLPTEVNADSPNQPVRGVTNILTYDTVLSIDTVRKASNRDFIATIQKRRDRAFGYFDTNQEKARQGQTLRLGGRRSGSNYPIYRPPIVG